MFSLRCKFLSHLRNYSAAVRRFSSKDTKERFTQAVEALNTLSAEPPNEVKLSLYALYKQATVGKCTNPKPGVFDLVGRAKWDAWNKLGAMTQEEAESQYAAMVENLAASSSGPTASPELVTKIPEGLVTTVKDGVVTIRFDRPSRKNSITFQMYGAIIQVLKEAAEREDVRLLVLTGTGDFFSSGNDLQNFLTMAKTGRNVDELAREAAEKVREYVAAFIDFPKPLVALVNGPCIGVACTVLGLFELVYASDKASFRTPFTDLGLSPEGCSSYTFPRIMGNARACEVLLMNKKLGVEEAKACGLISDFFPDGSFAEETERRVQALAKMPPKSLLYSKMLMRDVVKADLHAANNRECDRLVERFTSDEALQAVMNFFKAKGKL